MKEKEDEAGEKVGKNWVDGECISINLAILSSH
jgi:hypothetical protein